MKLKTILESSQPTENDIKKYFDVEGDIDITDDGINVNGDIYIKEGKKLPTLPFKFNIVNGTFDMQNCGLTNLKNFPNKAKSIVVADNPTLKTLEGGENSECDRFDASSTGVVNLVGCPQNVKLAVFSSCKNLESTEGLGNVQTLKAKNCPKLSQIRELLAKIPQTSVAPSEITYNPRLPMIKLILVNGAANTREVRVDNFPKNLDTLARDYNGKGLANAMEFIGAMRDLGLKDNARLH